MPPVPPPGHDCYNVTNMFSSTASQLGGHCPTVWLEQHKLFAGLCQSNWSAVSQQLGTRREHLHVQARRAAIKAATGGADAARLA